jgi:hypothetical protein
MQNVNTLPTAYYLLYILSSISILVALSLLSLCSSNHRIEIDKRPSFKVESQFRNYGSPRYCLPVHYIECGL